jgi:large repetitive protein
MLAVDSAAASTQVQPALFLSSGARRATCSSLHRQRRKLSVCSNRATRFTLPSSFTQTDTVDYTLTPTASTDCALSGSGSGTVAVGGACALAAAYTPTTFATTTDTVTFNGNLSNAALSTPSLVQLTLTGPATAPASTTTLGAFIPASPIYGQPVTLSATVTGAALTPTGSVVFTVDTSTYSITLASGTASTIVNGLTAGMHSVSAAYTSSNGYASSTSTTATLVVGQATPIVTWPTPAAITYGTALSATQLDATASVAGMLVYTPPAGTVLGAGTQTLSVLFTPADTTDYTSVGQSVQLTVNKAASFISLSANPNPAAQGKPDRTHSDCDRRRPTCRNRCLPIRSNHALHLGAQQSPE